MNEQHILDLIRQAISGATDRGGDTAFDREVDALPDASAQERAEAATAAARLVTRLGESDDTTEAAERVWYFLGEYVRRGQVRGLDLQQALQRLLAGPNGFPSLRPPDPRIRAQAYVLATTVGDVLTLDLLDQDAEVKRVSPGLWLSAVMGTSWLFEYLERLKQMAQAGVVGANALVLRAPSLAKRIRETGADTMDLASVFSDVISVFHDRTAAASAAEQISRIIDHPVSLDTGQSGFNGRLSATRTDDSESIAHAS
jgi:hypothetical protein